ncbi:DUF481 domain-containing protein [Stakelama pacifica]|nr:DUF481 domain-containing protein [Stakelama pacifica]GGO89828.1 hypothetical protein GCM10011329_00690 [Stakelama pacifica]
MRTFFSFLIALAGFPAIASAQAALPPEPLPISPRIQAMLSAAMDSGNEGEVNTVAKYASLADPDSADEINKLVSDWKSARTAQRKKHLKEADFFELVKGSVQIGGYFTTGNTNNTGLSGQANLTREGLDWRHRLKLVADYQRSAGTTTRRHYLAAYEPNYKLHDDLYIYGAFQYESDHFLGYDNRYSASTGAGYSAINRPGMSLDLELGPAYRRTDYVTEGLDSSPALRGSASFRWKLSPAVSFSQDASGYLQRGNSTVSTNTGLNAKLFGPVSGQLSYQIQYESQPRDKVQSMDTISRASVVYEF